jgi:ferredoxin
VRAAGRYKSRTYERPRNGGRGELRAGLVRLRGRLRSLESRTRAMEAGRVPGGLCATVDPDECVSCGMCRDACPRGAVSLAGGAAAVDKDRCTGCGLCVTVCPRGALSLRPVSGSGARSREEAGRGFPDPGRPRPE